MQKTNLIDKRLNLWLEQRGLRENPFAAWNAEQEPDLPSYFVDVQQFEELHYTATPCLVFARRGCGKTAQRQMLAAQYCPIRSDSSWLAIHYTFDRFEHVLSQVNEDASQIRCTHHINTLLSLGLAALMPKTAPGSAGAQKLADAKAGPRLVAYVARFAPHLSPAWLGDSPSPAILAQTSSLSLLRGFADLLHDAGLQGCVVLVDGLDEFQLMAGHPEQVAIFLAPLLGTLPILEFPELAFKFFLPHELEPVLRAQPWFRPDRLRLFHIAWDKPGLLQLIKQRLTHFSQRTPPYEDLAQLCEDALGQVINQELPALAGGVPRAALILAGTLLERHCRQPNPPELITWPTWEQVKVGWQFRRADFPLEEEEEVRPVVQPPPAPTMSAGPLLRLAEDGLVWIGNRDITSGINLQEYRVLACLYHHQDGVCTKDMLIEEAWSEDKQEEEEVFEQSITASIARLRRVLKKFSPDAEYVETIKGRGYRLHPAGFKAGMTET